MTGKRAFHTFDTLYNMHTIIEWFNDVSGRPRSLMPLLSVFHLVKEQKVEGSCLLT